VTRLHVLLHTRGEGPPALCRSAQGGAGRSNSLPTQRETGIQAGLIVHLPARVQPLRTSRTHHNAKAYSPFTHSSPRLRHQVTAAACAAHSTKPLTAAAPADRIRAAQRRSNHARQDVADWRQRVGAAGKQAADGRRARQRHRAARWRAAGRRSARRRSALRRRARRHLKVGQLGRLLGLGQRQLRGPRQAQSRAALTATSTAQQAGWLRRCYAVDS